MDVRFAAALEAIVGRRHALTTPQEIRAYAYDGGVDRSLPLAVVLPGSTEEVAAVVRACCERDMRFVPRGAGTGLSGGAIAAGDAIVISTARLCRILEIDAPNRIALVEPGVVNADVSAAAHPHGLRYVPDPSSMAACTIGGNIAENSGGLHCLAYGVTSAHVLGIRIVTPDGDIEWLGGKTVDTPGYDLAGVFIGSEGTLGIATQAVLALSPIPETVQTLLGIFDSTDAATAAVSAIIGRGIVPGALEMMDALATSAVEADVGAGLPTDAAALLLIDIEGLRDGLEGTVDAVASICRERGAREVRIAQDGPQRDLLWKGRKSAFGAMGRISPDYYVQDGVIPRSQLPAMLRDVAAAGTKHGLRIANVFHAGDGNLHPLILFDKQKEGEFDRALAAGADILQACVARGGSISGEHGIGLEKRDCMPLQFTPEDLSFMDRLKSAFNPDDRCNPGKIFPTGRRCGESARTAKSGTLDERTAALAGEPF
ncbi:MAG TPA: FAD-linked oxidase C-terminal domain-containing protein [Candidatus Eremiobacteraceae bacterium]|jgi:glycolate oxidase